MVQPTGPVVLVGPMGAGKTSIGKKLSRRLGVSFVDSDRVIVQRHGVISTLFAEHGEARFRAIERDVVAEALGSSGVVSLGGGAVLDADTRVALRDHRVVLLTVTAEAVATRLEGGSRPLIDRGGIDAWRAIALEREPLYREVASISLDTSHRPVSTVVDDIEAWLLSEKGTA